MTEAKPAKDRPTLRTIASETGFAVTTVSRALSGDPRIASGTRATISEAAERLGYVPDRAARRLRTGRTQVISLLINPKHEFLGFNDEILVGLTESLRGTGYSITIVPDFVTGDRLEAIRAIQRNKLADGVILTRTECFDPRIAMLLETDFPFVSHGRTEFTTPHPYVDFDNMIFARNAVRRLAEKGRKRISIVLPPDRFTFAQHLRHGFMTGVREAGLDYEIAEGVTIDSPADQIGAHIRQVRQGALPPDGYVCVGEVMAMTTLAALSDCGVVTGREVDVVAKRASPIFDHVRPRIETVLEDLRETGRDLARLLLRRIAGEPSAGLHRVQEPSDTFSLSDG